MEILNVNYSGYISVAKEDLVVYLIDPEIGEMVKIDTNKMETVDLLKKIKKGEYYVDLGACFKVALDGEEHIEVSVEEV